MSKIETLKKSKIFEALNDNELDIVSQKMSHVSLPEDTLILQAGEPGDTLYIIRKGSVKITGSLGGSEAVIATLEENQHFGEMAIIDNYPNSASVTTLEETELLLMTREDFESLTTEFEISNKLWKAIAEELCIRIRKTNRVVKDYVAVNKNLVENEKFREFYKLCTS